MVFVLYWFKKCRCCIVNCHTAGVTITALCVIQLCIHACVGVGMARERAHSWAWSAHLGERWRGQTKPKIAWEAVPRTGHRRTAAGVILPSSNSRIFRGFGWRRLCAGRTFLALMNVGVTGQGVGTAMKRSPGVNRRKIEQGTAEQTSLSELRAPVLRRTSF